MSDGRSVAIITGAGSGVGRAAARRLVEAGYRVALVGRTEGRLRETGAGLGAERDDWIAVVADVTSDPDRARMVSRTTEAFGRIDALVNNAGQAGLCNLREQTVEGMRSVFEINAIGPIDLAARCLRVMRDAGGGVVVFTSSMSARDPFPGLGVYGGAKAACNVAALAIANEESEHGIRAYAVAPGAVETAMLRSLWDEGALPRERTLDPDRVAEVIVECVTGRTGARSGETIYLPSP